MTRGLRHPQSSSSRLRRHPCQDDCVSHREGFLGRAEVHILLIQFEFIAATAGSDFRSGVVTGCLKIAIRHRAQLHPLFVWSIRECDVKNGRRVRPYREFTHAAIGRHRVGSSLVTKCCVPG
jgi:hypothetical protein